MSPGVTMPDLNSYALALSRQRLDIRDLAREFREHLDVEASRRAVADKQTRDILERIELAEGHLEDLAKILVIEGLRLSRLPTTP